MGHDANYKFMHKLYDELMAVNKHSNGIDNLHDINKKLENDDVLWSKEEYKTRKDKDKRSESIHLLKSTKWEQPLSSLDEEEDVPFDLTSFDVSILEMDIEEEMD